MQWNYKFLFKLGPFKPLPQRYRFCCFFNGWISVRAPPEQPKGPSPIPTIAKSWNHKLATHSARAYDPTQTKGECLIHFLTWRTFLTQTRKRAFTEKFQISKKQMTGWHQLLSFSKICGSKKNKDPKSLNLENLHFPFMIKEMLGRAEISDCLPNHTDSYSFYDSNIHRKHYYLSHIRDSYAATTTQNSVVYALKISAK